MTGRSASRISSTDARPFGLMLIVMPFALVSARTCPISLPEAAVRAGFAFGEGAGLEGVTAAARRSQTLLPSIFSAPAASSSFCSARKTVVVGKMVSVRVDLGVGRFLKKKKKKN